MIGSGLISPAAIRLTATTVCCTTFKPHTNAVHICRFELSLSIVESAKSGPSLLMRAISGH